MLEEKGTAGWDENTLCSALMNGEFSLYSRDLTHGSIYVHPK